MKPKIIHHYAECAPNCNDRDCPYTHAESWEVNGWFYATEKEAQAALAAMGA